jgi:hypothetical protein
MTLFYEINGEKKKRRKRKKERKALSVWWSWKNHVLGGK